MSTDGWSKVLEKRVLLGSAAFFVVALIVMYMVAGFRLGGFPWFVAGGLISGALSYLLFPVILRQQLPVSLMLVFLSGFWLSFATAGLLGAGVRVEDFVAGVVFGWVFGSGRLFWSRSRGATTILGYALVFALAMVFGVISWELLS